MRARLLPVLAAVVLGLLQASAAWAEEEACGMCHGAERVLHRESVHRAADVGCASCHGGDPTTAESREAAHSVEMGFQGRVDRADVPETCGGCHADVVLMRPYDLRTDALAAYRSSHHGKAVLEQGRTDAAVCTDCHGGHDIRRVDDPASPAYRQNVPATCGSCHGDAALMARSGLGATAPDQFARSIHGKKLARGEPGVPSCADCHDAHAAAPPGAAEVAEVCGHCHRDTREQFVASPHLEASRRGLMEQCVTCHGNHSVDHPEFSLFDRPPAEDSDSTHCLSCHEEDQGAATGLEIGRMLRETTEQFEQETARVEHIAAQGYYMDDERDSLDRARRALVRALPLTHSVDLVRVRGALRRAHSLVEEARISRDKKERRVRDRKVYGTLAGFILLGISFFLVLRRRSLKVQGST